jgi:single-stranded-DNA-specific exonuclease
MKWQDAPTLDTDIPELHPLLSRALQRRGLTTLETACPFLDPAAYSPSPAVELPGLPGAVERLKDAIHSREPICIWGDFDADGQTATSILVQTLQTLGASVRYHVPIRSTEGHGVTIPALDKIIKDGVTLIVTCDTGITAHQAVEFSRARGVDMIITDHHEIQSGLIPPAVAVVTPKMLSPLHPLASLSGAGVAFKLAEELLTLHDRSDRIADLLDITAIGLVADLAALIRDTRYLVQMGLAALRNTRRLGLQQIMKLAELHSGNLTEEHIGFVIGPRLNALGRLGDANAAVELLTTHDSARALLLASQLENYNSQRQFLTSQVTRAAEAQLLVEQSLLAQPVIVLTNPSWHAGVIGIAAAHLVERYHKPAILLTQSVEGQMHGSARSIDGIDITAAITAVKDLLLNFGGHPMAAGLSLQKENLPLFRTRLTQVVETMYGKDTVEEPLLLIDQWLKLQDANLELAETLEQLSPYGNGNGKLILATQNLRLRSSSIFGRNKEHLRLQVEDNSGFTQQITWWNGSGEELPDGLFDIAYTLRASDWRGTRDAQLEFVDFRYHENAVPVALRKKPDIMDYRLAENPSKVLESIMAQPGTIVWAEAEDKEATKGLDRFSLVESRAMAIWTIPPSPGELIQAVEKVHPETIFLFASVKGPDSPEGFIKRLVGMIKFAINKREGHVSYQGLAAGTAQSLETVRRGVELLVSDGVFQLFAEIDNQLVLTNGSLPQTTAKENPIRKELQLLIKETNAYRSHYLRADKDSLFLG